MVIHLLFQDAAKLAVGVNGHFYNILSQSGISGGMLPVGFYSLAQVKTGAGTVGMVRLPAAAGRVRFFEPGFGIGYIGGGRVASLSAARSFLQP